MTARLADQLRQRFLIMSEILDQAAIGARLFDRVEVLLLDILDQRDLVSRGIVEFAHKRGNLVQPRALRRAPAPFAGDELETPRRRANVGR